MPIYTYRCPSGHAADLIRPMVAEMVACPSCGQQAVKDAFYRIHQAGAPEKRYNLTAFKEADAEIKYESARRGETPPDLLGMAKRRRGVRVPA